MLIIHTFLVYQMYTICVVLVYLLVLHSTHKWYSFVLQQIALKTSLHHIMKKNVKSNTLTTITTHFRNVVLSERVLPYFIGALAAPFLYVLWVVIQIALMSLTGELL